MKQLIIRADDLGICEAVNYGIEKTVKEGLVRSVGLMPNMPAALHGYNLIKDVEGVCIGQHTNVCLGKPLADPSLIPSLLDENGNLKSSRMYRAAFKQGQEIAKVDELVIEIEAQYHRFLEIVGHKPGYFEAHAVASNNLFAALKIVAEKYDLKLLEMSFIDPIGKFNGQPFGQCTMDSMSDNYVPFETLKREVGKMEEDMPYMFVCHPGYLDDFLLNNSSLTINRTKEVTMLINPATKEWLDDQDLKLINYDEIA